MRTIKAGTRVRVKTRSFSVKGIGTMMEDSHFRADIIHVMMDGGPTLCCREDIAVLRDQTPGPEPMRYRLPYGMWTCPDGREVLFNRDYKPIWQRRPGEAATSADREEQVQFDREEWFYTDVTSPWCVKATIPRCEAVLTSWGVPT